MTYKVIQGNNIEVLKTFPDNSFDSIVTDPPYGIDFLGKDWDSDTGSLETYQECLRVLKPGGHLLAFSAARTYHHLAMTIEQAGFEIRDQIMWIYSSGFPKSQDVGRAIAKKNNNIVNTKTYLPIIDDNRNTPNSTTGSPRCKECNTSGWVGRNTCSRDNCIMPWIPDQQDNDYNGWGTNLKPAHEPICMARKPVKGSIINNVQQYGTGAINIDATRIPTEDVIINSAGNKNTFTKFNPENNVDGPGTGNKVNNNVEKWNQNPKGRFPSNVIGEIEGYQKYFYCPKVNKAERGDNNHPTVKPVELMKYLIKLVTPKGGTVLDPFNGSGSTGMACVESGYNYVGIELDSNYVDISVKRIDAHDKKHNINSELFVVE